VQQLQLAVTLEAAPEAAGALPAEAGEASNILAAMLATCGTSGQLAELELNVQGLHMPLTAWAVGLTSLQSLQFTCRPQMVVSASLRALSALTALKLYSHSVALQPGAHLPPGLARLRIDGRLEGGVLPPQVGGAR